MACRLEGGRFRGGWVSAGPGDGPLSEVLRHYVLRGFIAFFAQCLSKSARTCQNLLESVRICQNLPGSARIQVSLTHGGSRICVLQATGPSAKQTHLFCIRHKKLPPKEAFSTKQTHRSNQFCNECAAASEQESNRKRSAEALSRAAQQIHCVGHTFRISTAPLPCQAVSPDICAERFSNPCGAWCATPCGAPS